MKKLYPSIGRMLVICAVGLSVSANASITEPPPPPTNYEIWNPVDRTHLVSADCANSSAEVAWSFKAGGAKIESFTFNSLQLGPDVIEVLNDRVGEIGGDFHALIDCSDTIVRVLFIQAKTRFGEEPMRLQIVTDGIELLQVRRFGFG